MSTVIVVTPIIVANWPVLTAAVTAAMASTGFSLLHQSTAAVRQLQQRESTAASEIEVENSEIIAGTAGTDQQLVVQREDGVRAVFRRDAAGRLKLSVEGCHLSKGELQELADTLLGRVTQQYVYHRIVSELEQKQMAIVHEEVTDSQSVKIRVRNW